MKCSKNRFRSMQRRLVSSLVTMGVAALGTIAFTGPLHAQTDADLRAGFYTDPDAVSFGGGFLTRIGGVEDWYFNPNVEFGFSDFRDVFSTNLDFHYDFPAGRTTAMWLGAGPAILFSDREPGGSDVDLGLNLLAGFGAANGALRPYGQFKGVMSDDSRIALMGGVHF